MGSLTVSYAVRSATDNAFPLKDRRTTIKCQRNLPWKQHGSNAAVIDFAEKDVEGLQKLSSAELDLYKTPQGKFDLNALGIEHALDARIALFFLQCIVCYKMPFHFDSKGADGQIGSASALTLKDISNRKIVHKREAAHSSTTPCLMAYLQADWDAFVKNPKSPVPQGFVYMKGSHCYLQQNATVGMNECVNGADELLDGNPRQSKLRKEAVEIINLVAGGLDPAKATKLFIIALEAQAAKQGAPLAADDARKLVLGKYEQLAKDIKKEAEDPEFFNRLLCVQLNVQDPKFSVLRDIVFKKRYATIRYAAVVENRIAKKIETAKEKLPNNQKALLEFALLKMASTSNKIALEKLLGKTAEVLEPDYIDTFKTKTLKTSARRFQSQVDSLTEKQNDFLKGVLNELNKDLSEITDTELNFRAELFKDLRNDYKGWTQQRFVDKFKKLYPNHSMSRPMVSRLEQRARLPTKAVYLTHLSQRRKDLSITDARHIAKTFGIDSGLFFPGL